MNRWKRLRIAVICALTQWSLIVLLQARTCFGFVIPPSAWTFETGTSFFNVLPSVQKQNALIALLFGCVAYFAALPASRLQLDGARRDREFRPSADDAARIVGAPLT